MLAGLDFTVALVKWKLLDDALVKNETRRQHSEHIQRVFKSTQDYGLKLNEEKCYFFSSNIKFFRQVIHARGRRPDLSRTSAIKNMPSPSNVSNHF